MSSITVVDVNNEEAKQEPEPVEQIEEAKEEVKEEQPTIQNEVVETPPKIEKEQPKEEESKNNSKTERYKDKNITCPKCSKSMLLRSYRYKHEKNCTGNIENKPIKPKAKPQPKAVPQPIYEEEEEEQKKPLSKPVKNQILKPQPVNPLTNIQQHYQLLHQQYIKEKQEKYNNLCQNMFKTKLKKR